MSLNARAHLIISLDMFLRRVPVTKLHFVHPGKTCSIALYQRHVLGNKSCLSARGLIVQGQLAGRVSTTKLHAVHIQGTSSWALLRKHVPEAKS